MILGHFALALGGTRLTPTVSLGTLVVAAQWPDLLWPVLVLVGIERVAVVPGTTVFTPLDFVYYPWSHSLLMGVVWGVLLGGLYYVWKHNRADALLVGALVPSHWVLDLVVHRPDLPLYPGGPTVGFGLWNSVGGTLLVEFGLFAIGSVLYLAATSPRDRIGNWGGIGFLVLLVVLYLGASFGPPPGESTMVALGALALWLLVPVAYWIDAHRTRRGSAHTPLDRPFSS